MNNFIQDLLAQLTSYYNDIIEVIPRLLMALIVFFLFYSIAKRTGNYLNQRLTKRMDDPLLARFIARLTQIFLVIIGLMVVLKIIGLTDIAAGLITGASVSAIVVGFAFKDIGENFLAGIILAFDRPFGVGDVVEIDGHIGKVLALNIRNTQIKTFDGKDIYIPNAKVVKTSVINYTMDGYLRYDFEVKLDNKANIEKAVELITEALLTVPGVLGEEKPPTVFISSLGSSTLTLTVFYWINTTDPSISALGVKTGAVNKVVQVLIQNGFHLPGEIVEFRNYTGRGPIDLLTEQD